MKYGNKYAWHRGQLDEVIVFVCNNLTVIRPLPNERQTCYSSSPYPVSISPLTICTMRRIFWSARCAGRKVSDS